MGSSYSTPNLLESTQDRNDGALMAVSAGQVDCKNSSTCSTVPVTATTFTNASAKASATRNGDIKANSNGGEVENNNNDVPDCVLDDEDYPENVYSEEDDIYGPGNERPLSRSPYNTVTEVISCSKSCPSLTSFTSYPQSSEVIMEEIYEDDHDPTPQSDLRNELYRRRFHIVTTAALPWFTGTAVNPLLRAAYILKQSREQYESDFNKRVTDASKSVDSTGKLHSNVTLVIPWLIDKADRLKVYGESRIFNCEADQEAYIRSWMHDSAYLPNEADAETGVQIMFYPSKYHAGLGSIFAMGDICSLIRDEDADVCILEEPEHLNWYKAPSTDNWPRKFCHVVGIIHTNYKAYAWSTITGLLTAPAIELISKLMAGYCHRIIKLSPVLQDFAQDKDVICNVHGVRSEFLLEGERRSNDPETECFGNSIGKTYFIGKLLWAKGLDVLLTLQELYKSITGDYFEIDIYGSGPEELEIIRAFNGRKTNLLPKSTSDSRLSRKRKIELPKSFREFTGKPIPANFRGRVDHAQLKGEYKVFVNPSITEVLCTTTAEALAMGKFAIIPAHPSNVFFSQFPNCLMYDPNNKAEFVANMRYALTHSPQPLGELHHIFTWEAATQRFLDASIILKRSDRLREIVGKSKRDETIAKIHYLLSKGRKGDVLRKMLGAGPASHQVQYMQETSRNKSCLF